MFADALEGDDAASTTASAALGEAAALAAGGLKGVPADDVWALGGTCPQAYWSCPGTADLRVRGKNYLTDRKKIPAALPMFELLSADLVQVDEPLWHVGRHLPAVKCVRGWGGGGWEGGGWVGWWEGACSAGVWGRRAPVHSHVFTHPSVFTAPPPHTARHRAGTRTRLSSSFCS